MTFIRSTIGRKFVMALTGVVLVVFAIAHISGNLLVFRGPDAIREYAIWLREVGHGAILLGLRIGLVVAALLHAWAATSLTLENRRARPVGYREAEYQGSTLASRTMRWSGYLFLAYVVYHLLDMTWGTVHPDFIHLDPYHNLIIGFQRTPVALMYIGAMILLGLHLYHGLWSMIRTLGLSHPRYIGLVELGAKGLAVLLTILYCSIPLAVMAGVLK